MIAAHTGGKHMKHAGDQALDQIEALLRDVRQIDGLSERGRGKFYRQSVAVLHFHEDPAGMFADLKVRGDWRRLPVNTPAQCHALIAAVQRVAGSGKRSSQSP
jgi:hypothetical protein